MDEDPQSPQIWKSPDCTPPHALGPEHPEHPKHTNITPLPSVPLLVAIVASDRSYHPDSIDFRVPDSFHRALDGLASLCISRPAQVLSLGFQIDSLNSQLVITIADTHEVAQDTIDHLSNLWAILRKISDLAAAAGPKPSKHSKMTRTALEHELVQLVYSFAKYKTLERWRKWWGSPGGQGLLGFARTFQQRKHRPISEVGVDQDFMVLLSALRIAASHLNGDNPDWVEMNNYMETAISYADKIRPSWCDDLARDLADPNTTPSPVCTALTKLMSPTRAICALISYTLARSPRHRLAFTLNMSIRTVPPHNVHPECALIAHYDSLRSTASYIPPLKSIALSHPPCRLCSVWIGACNERSGGPVFRIRATCGAWCYTWTAPAGVEGVDVVLDTRARRMMRW